MLLAKRREIIGKYDKELSALNVKIMNHYGKDYASSGHLYLVRLNGMNREQCNNVITKMAENGIATNVHYKPLPLLTAYKAQGFQIEDFPNAYAHYEHEITLPLHSGMSEDDVEYVSDVFKCCAGY